MWLWRSPLSGDAEGATGPVSGANLSGKRTEWISAAFGLPDAHMLCVQSQTAVTGSPALFLCRNPKQKEEICNGVD